MCIWGEQKGFYMLDTNDKRCQWHPACYAALNLEFVDNKNDLEFHQEIPINVLPLRIDTLIIKKKKKCSIKNEIGKLFRVHNLVEYKSPDDEFNFNTVLKGIAYAYLYKISEVRIGEILLDEITLSFIRERKPRKLFNNLRQDKFLIEEKFKGIYYICKEGFIPIQIIVSGELEYKNHVWLNSLTKKLDRKRAEELITITTGLDKVEDKQFADSVWEVITRMNRKLVEKMREDENMCKAMAEIFKPEIDAAAEIAFHRGVNDKGVHVFKNMLKRGFSREEAQSIAEISDELVERALAELKG